METCTNFYEKILLFDDLSPADQEEVKAHTQDCAACRQHLSEIQSIMVSLKSSGQRHALEDDMLVRYSIHLSAPEEADYDGKKLTRSELRTIRGHLDECHDCQQRLQQLQLDYQEIADYVEEADLPDISLAPKRALLANLEKPLTNFAAKTLENLQSALGSLKQLLYMPMPKYVPVAIGAMAVFIMFWIGPFFRAGDNPYFDLASLRQENISVATRGGQSQPFSQGLSSFQRGEFAQAIQRLEQFVAENPDDPSLFYAHYLLGISYLIESEHRLLGRFKNFDVKQIDLGVHHLETAASLSDNSGMKEDCDWYIGRAYLMKGDSEKARAIFEKIFDLRGRRFNEARQMILEIDTILNSN